MLVEAGEQPPLPVNTMTATMWIARYKGKCPTLLG